MAFQVIYAGSRLTAALINSLSPLGVIKPADQDVTSSTAMVNDNDLVLPVVAGAGYLFACYLQYNGGTAGSSDLRWQWEVPVAAVLRYGADYRDTSLNPVVGLTSLAATTNVAGTNGGALMSVRMTGSLTVGAAGGTIQLTWTQNTSSSTPTAVKAESSLGLVRVS